jgi:hypothetical protein
MFGDDFRALDDACVHLCPDIELVTRETSRKRDQEGGRDMRNDPEKLRTLTTRQFGDACEYAVLAELNFGGLPATKMPDGWPGHDLLVGGRTDGKISVKGIRARSHSRWWRFPPTGWDWMALVWFTSEGDRFVYLLPRSWIEANAVVARGHYAGWYVVYFGMRGLERFRDNFSLSGSDISIEEAVA